ncbi:MAG: NfeD family protein [Clostridiales bacterium]|nr:NfeD family protein [Clostridiales bacterium]
MLEANPFIWFWLVCFAVLLLAEMAAPALTTIWFAAGSLAALVLAAAGCRVSVQFIAMAAVAFVLLLSVRPLAKDRFNRGRVKTNAEALVGTEAVVTEEIDNRSQAGRVKAAGQDWAARNAEGSEKIRKGETVRVVELSGATLYVISVADY